MEINSISQEEKKSIIEAGREFAYEGLGIERYKDLSDEDKKKCFLEGYKEALEEMKEQKQSYQNKKR